MKCRARALEVRMADSRQCALALCVGTTFTGHVVAVARPRSVCFGHEASRCDDGESSTFSSAVSTSTVSTTSRGILVKTSASVSRLPTSLPMMQAPPRQSSSGRPLETISTVSGPPLGPPFELPNEYLEDCSLSCLDDLVGTWNFEVNGCCAWHSQLHRLSSLVERMKGWHACSEGWLPHASAWQCGNCLALVSPDRAHDFCWVCNADREPATRRPKRSKRSSSSKSSTQSDF